ncbi:MAG: competence/damage-inducible protein A [Actinomycetota bacterium]|nr:competence/damage-inducible protein A [Actinomycetota bacterium]
MAVGTELLLGQVLDTNSSWLGDRLAQAGIDSHYQSRVGDNRNRIAGVLQTSLTRSDAVIVCGGLGPTPDDVTREAIADVLGVPLVRDDAMAADIRGIFESRRGEMAASNLRQAERPQGAAFIPQRLGTAPGLICNHGDKVLYAVPGVPQEMTEMVDRAVIPDLQRRADDPAVIVSRVLRTWGVAESTLAEMVAPVVVNQTNPTIAFLAGGIEGLKIRLTAKALNRDAAAGMLDEKEAELRAILGDLIFGVDAQSMERVVADLLVERELTLGVAESLTGGLVGARLAETEGASAWFRGSIVAYDSKIKYDLLDVPEGPVVCAEAAEAMARGACKALRADVGLGVTGVAGPTRQEDQPVGTVFMAVANGSEVKSEERHFPGERQHVRQYATISVLSMLRTMLLAGD